MAWRHILLVLALMTLSPYLAYSGGYEDTLHDISLLNSGGYGAPVAKYTQVGGEFATMTGARGAWIINHSFAVGAGFYRLSSNIDRAMTPSGERTLGGFDLHYKGVELEYIMKPESVLHMVFYLLIGSGKLSFSHYDAQDDDVKLVEDDLLVAEPALNLQVNLTSWCRIDLGVGLRYAFGVEDKAGDHISDKNMGGMTGTLAFKFGSF